MLRCATSSSELFNTILYCNGFLINSVFALFTNVFFIPVKVMVGFLGIKFRLLYEKKERGKLRSLERNSNS